MEKTIKSIEIALENELIEREFYLKHRKTDPDSCGQNDVCTNRTGRG